MLKKMLNAGRVTKKPELHYTADGKAVCKFTIAVNDGGDKVEFVDVVTWNKLAENCSQYLDRGKPVLVEGHWELRSYTNKQGENKVSIEMNGKRHALDIIFLPSGGNTARTAPSGTETSSSDKAKKSDEFVPEIEDDDVPL